LVFRYSLRLPQLAGITSAGFRKGPFSRAGLSPGNGAQFWLTFPSAGFGRALTLNVAMIISCEGI
jgi:hypothetical protein